MLSDHVLLFLDKYRKKYIENVKRINSLKFIQLEIHVDNRSQA